MRNSLVAARTEASQYRKPHHAHNFKGIDLREQPRVNMEQHLANRSFSNSPEVTRHLYSSGMVFKNSNSPIACDIRISPDFKINPRVPFSPVAPTVQSRVSMKSSPFARPLPTVGEIGWGLNNPNLEQNIGRKVLMD